ncbi:MAG: hypothetical protein FWC93_05210 [Defluviitaleaceae bacterium]|nr:hypothetical protein [Defluviitaleaceae bacterium]
MEKYSRRNHAQRHYRVARREVAVSPSAQLVKIKKNGPKIAVAGIAILILLAVKWFAIGYFVGKSR